ncbi:dihydrofolate reductase family protein [Streptomyces sp. NPDC020192]|uniref:dihydrofolate reductase family protein n=1 Tax=Streptomyces sp. NPDC020192 TaxID=3365066 RepID=UPI003793B464
MPARGAYGRERTTGARGVRAERRDVVLTGSLAVVDALRQEDLVDEYRLMTFLVVLGQGRRLFPDGTSPAGLECLSAAHVPLGRRLPGLRRFAA